MSEKNFDELYQRAKALLEEIEILSQGKTRLMAVTKFQPEDAVRAVLVAGVPLVGESRGQEFRDKFPLFASCGAETHFIGNLQKNKLKYVVGKADVIESIGSFEIAEAVSSYALEHGIVQDVLLEINAGREASKSGFAPEDAEAALYHAAALGGIRVRGIMTMAPIADSAEVERTFAHANKLFIDMSSKKLDNVSMDLLSMGMSRDYRLAIKHGSNIVRLGRTLFGDR